MKLHSAHRCSALATPELSFLESQARMSWRTQYPFESRFWNLSSGPRMHYIDEGLGPCVLFVHGNPTWSFHFRKLFDALRNQYRTIAIDHIGCGLSDKPQTYPYSLAQHTRNLTEFIAGLELTDITVVGHDWGGAISLNAVRHNPHRFARIALMNTGAFPPPRIPWRIAVCRTPVFGSWALRGLNVFARAALRMTMVNPAVLDANAIEGILAPYDSWQHRIGIQRFVEDIPFSSRHPTWQELKSLEAALPELEMPKLLVWGLQDWCFDRACFERFQTIWPEARSIAFADAGHWVVEEKPNCIIAELREFLHATPSP